MSVCRARREDNEMALREGDLLTVVHVHRNDWALAVNAHSGAEGLVPLTYIEPVPEVRITISTHCVCCLFASRLTTVHFCLNADVSR